MNTRRKAPISFDLSRADTMVLSAIILAAAAATAGAARADVVPLGLGYLIGRGSAPSTEKAPGQSIQTGTAKCFIKVGALTVDAFQITSITHAYNKNHYTCGKDQWLNTVGLANGQTAQACTLVDIQAQVFKDMEKCK